MPLFINNSMRVLKRAARLTALLLGLLAAVPCFSRPAGWTGAQGSDGIPFPKQTSDLGPIDTVAAADANRGCNGEYRPGLS